MNTLKTVAVAVAALVALSLNGASSSVLAQDEPSAKPELTVMGGVNVLNQNDTSLPDRFVNVPLVGTLGYRLSRVLTAEGEFTWMIPVKQEVELAGSKLDRKTPDILAYQLNLRADLPGRTTWSPYFVAGAGALTVLSNTDAERLPQLDESETMFALNFGGGVNYGLGAHWTLRGDFREFVAFPSDQATGLSNGGEADRIWMERATLGLGYRF